MKEELARVVEPEATGMELLCRSQVRPERERRVVGKIERTECRLGGRAARAVLEAYWVRCLLLLRFSVLNLRV